MTSDHQPRSLGWTFALVFALVFALTACAYFFGRERDLARDLDRAADAAGRRAVEAARWNAALAILSGRDTEALPFAGRSADDPAGNIFWSRERGFVLAAHNLPPAPAGKTYQAWLAFGGPPRSAGVFDSTPAGALHVWRGTLPASPLSLTVTLEPAAGSASPTSLPVITAFRPPVP